MMLFLKRIEDSRLGSGRAPTQKRDIQGGTVQVQLKRSESDGEIAYVVTLYINQT